MYSLRNIYEYLKKANEEADYDDTLVNLTFDDSLNREVWTVNSDTGYLDLNNLNKLLQDNVTLEYMQNSLRNGAIFKQNLFETDNNVVSVLIAYKNGFKMRYEIKGDEVTEHTDLDKSSLKDCLNSVQRANKNSISLKKIYNDTYAIQTRGL